MELHLKGEPVEALSDYDQRRGLWRKGMPQPVWQCGACGREYSLLDGTVVFGPNSGCTCPEMPQTIRITRAAREITRLAEETLPTSMEALDIREVQERLNVARVEVAKLERAERTLMACTAHGATCPCLVCVERRGPLAMKFEDGRPA